MSVPHLLKLVLALFAGSSAAVGGVAAHSPAQALPAAPAASQKPIGRAAFLERVQARFNAIDTDHDGTLDLNEIDSAQQKGIEQALELERQRLEAEFARLDTNHDGALSKSEFMAVLAPVHARQTPKQVLDELDSNRDGKVSLEEYEAGPLAKFDRLNSNHDKSPSPQQLKLRKEVRP